MNYLDVYDRNCRKIGWLILYNQQYYPYTEDGERLPMEFFNRYSAEYYLRQYAEGKITGEVKRIEVPQEELLSAPVCNGAAGGKDE